MGTSPRTTRKHSRNCAGDTRSSPQTSETMKTQTNCSVARSVKIEWTISVTAVDRSRRVAMSTSGCGPMRARSSSIVAAVMAPSGYLTATGATAAMRTIATSTDAKRALGVATETCDGVQR